MNGRCVDLGPRWFDTMARISRDRFSDKVNSIRDVSFIALRVRTRRGEATSLLVSRE